MKTQQTLNTVLAVLVASFLAERWDALIFDPNAPGFQANVANMEFALTALIGGSLSWVIEALRVVALDATQGRMPRLYKLLGGA